MDRAKDNRFKTIMKKFWKQCDNNLHKGLCLAKPSEC